MFSIIPKDEWYLSEGVVCQTILDYTIIPVDPPASMLRPSQLSNEDRTPTVVDFPTGDFLYLESSYEDLVTTHLSTFSALVPVSTLYYIIFILGRVLIRVFDSE